MTGRIGTLANLLPILPESSHSLTHSDNFTFVESPGARWAFRSKNSLKKRTWEVDFDVLKPSELGALMELANGAWGVEPKYFVSCAAHDNNVLTPSQSYLGGVANGGVLNTTDSVSPVSLVGGALTTIASKVPVAPGLPLSVQVDASGATTLRVILLNSTGGVVSTKEVSSDGVLMQKVGLSIPVVPANARYANITVSGFTAVAHPQVTWTRKPPKNWCSGLGASSVVVEAPSYQSITSKHFGSSIKIVEVG